MKILILFQFSNHNQTIDELCNNLNVRGIKVNSLNVATWRFRNYKKGKPLWLSLLSAFAAIPILGDLLADLCRYKALLKLSGDYTIIDIHFFSPIYDKFIEELKKRKAKVKITIWGSDFYRVDKIRRDEQRRIYQMIDIIQTETRQIANDFLSVYPECISKIRIAHFGITQFDIIDDLLREGSCESYKKEMNLPQDKIIITCGNNGSYGHRHLLILESIERLAPEIKEQLFLMIPMTYGGDKSYIKRIRQKAESLKLPYKIHSSFLTINDICKLSIVSDITLTIQITDALSSAILEHLYTGEILIAGEWLPYQILNENGVFFLPTPLDSLTKTISDSIVNFKSLKKKCSGNNVGLSKLFVWNNAVKNWLTIYNEINN